MVKSKDYDGEERRRNYDGRWQLAFWVVTVICGSWLLTLTSNVVANDRMRASEDDRIQSVLEMKIDKISERQIQVLQDIRQMKTMLGKAYGKL